MIHEETSKKRPWLRATMAAGIAAGLLAVSVGDASAQWRRHRGPSGGAVAAGVVGGLALGALAAGAARGYPAPAYGYAPAPVYVEPSCWYEREDVWNGYTYVPRRVRVCQ